MKKQKPQYEYRVKFSIDEFAEFEECNGEARPLTEPEYTQSQYYGCPNGHYGPSYTKPKHSGIGYCGQCHARFAPIGYDEYRRYYGNPDRHLYFSCVVERRTALCRCCGQYGAWTSMESLHAIDMMDDDPEVNRTRDWITGDLAWTMGGYFQSVARDLLTEAGYKPTAAAKGKTK